MVWTGTLRLVTGTLLISGVVDAVAHDYGTFVLDKVFLGRFTCATVE